MKQRRMIKESLTFLFLVSLSAPGFSDDILTALKNAAPAANPHALQLAVQAMECAQASGVSSSKRLAVIDYSKPSTDSRMWVFDLTNQTLLYEERVAHGKNSGENLAQVFSNEPDSLTSSLGLYRTLQTYQGKHGYSLRMEGLDTGFNDKALERAIVIHGAAYLGDDMIKKTGRIGRSWGCPALDSGIARQVIDELKNGQFVFSYYPDQHWMSTSTQLNCRTRIAKLDLLQ